MNETTFETNNHTAKSARRQKSTSDRLKDKLKQLNKAKASLEAAQKKIKQLEADIKELEAKRQQEILKEYGMSLSDLEAFLADNKDKPGGDA